MTQLLEQLLREQRLVIIGVALSLTALAALLLVRRLRRRRSAAEPPQPDLSLDIGSLSSAGPPSRGPRLELYNIPMRLAVLVLAPTGRGSQLPNEEQVTDLVDQIVPGLMRVVEAHQPVIRRWPVQLSSEGFANTFFANVPLPGNKGKGTPWAGLAGRCEWEGQNFQIGMILCAAAPNSLGQLIVQRESQWLDMLRVRG